MKCKWKVIKRYIGTIMMIELHYEHEPLFSTQHIALYYRPHSQFKRYAINVNTTVPVTSSLDTKVGLSLYQCEQSYDDGRHYQRHHNLTLQTHQTSTYCEEDQSATLS